MEPSDYQKQYCCDLSDKNEHFEEACGIKSNDHTNDQVEKSFPESRERFGLNWRAGKDVMSNTDLPEALHRDAACSRPLDAPASIQADRHLDRAI